MIKVNVYLYDSTSENGYRGADYSKYVLAGAQDTEDITEELDLSEITLQGLDKPESFAPSTKFIIDIVEISDVIDKNILVGELFTNSIPTQSQLSDFVEEKKDRQPLENDQIFVTIQSGEQILYTYLSAEWQGENFPFTSTVKTLHRCVQEDLVDKPILSDDHYYKHTITLIEPSVIAQKRIVDNISITYKLKDVSLDTTVDYNLEMKAETDITNSEPANPPRGFANYEDVTSGSRTRNTSFGKYFKWWKGNDTNDTDIKVVYNQNNQEVISDLRYLRYQDIDDNINNQKEVQFEIPVPHIMWGVMDGRDGAPTHRPPILQDLAYANIGIASFEVVIKQYDLNGDLESTIQQNFISNSNLHGNLNTIFPFYWAINKNSTVPERLRQEFLAERVYAVADPYVGQFNNIIVGFNRYTDVNGGQDFSSIKVRTNPMVVDGDKSYTISIYVHTLGGEIPNIDWSQDIVTTQPPISIPKGASGFYDGDPTSFCYYKIKDPTSIFVTGNVYNSVKILPKNNYIITNEFVIYDHADATATLASGLPYSALSLIKKAIINSDIYFKEDGLDSTDINAGKYPFYISDGANENEVTQDELSLTQVNESFFHQKNLWEILLEVGKYVHAVPEITFGDDDRFLISFKKLGITNESTNQGTKIGVMNFRQIDDYIAACSSYVDNLVQLGGEIIEPVAPKTESEEYLVYNDNACLITSKPIIELLQVTVKCNSDRYSTGDYAFAQDGDECDITNYIYEKNVYNILSVKRQDVPNKGIAMYYNLGDNAIKGGDYQLPEKVVSQLQDSYECYSDYAIKKIIYFGFVGSYTSSIRGVDGPWKHIRVNDFVFTVTYRTKDSARLEHTRPDLRHYLLSSKYDRYPALRQFNNQQDVLVDSVLFGGNMFGKLIKTGNNNYKINEWCNEYSELKHKGELYRINNDLYYVAKVTNVFFPNHIESVVEYSKDYNQLSAIIGIPSEPRFYEISEQSSIDREVAINDYILVTTDWRKTDPEKGFIVDLTHTLDLAIGGNEGTYLRWAVSEFKGDPDTGVTVKDGEIVQFAGEQTWGIKDFSKRILSPINAYSSGNTLTYEWDMVDNFSAGDKVTDLYYTVDDVDDKSYRAMKAVQYCDKYGKATLFNFYLYGELNLSPDEIRALPECPEIQSADYIVSTANIGKSIVLLKDNRETLHFNYNVMQITDSDTFVLSPFFFAEKQNYAKVVFLKSEVNKLSNGYINKNDIITDGNGDEISFDAIISTESLPMDTYMEDIDDSTFDQIKAIVIMEKNQTATMQRFTLAKNIPSGTTKEQASASWYFGAPNKDEIWTFEKGNRQ